MTRHLADGVPTVEYSCLRCDYRIDMASGLSDETIIPAAGAASLCIRCGNFAIFTGSGTSLALRPVTAEELQELIDDPEVVAMLYARHRAVAQYGDAWNGTTGT